jgi:hypothetical protein
MPLYTFMHNLLNVVVQIANKLGLQKKMLSANIPCPEICFLYRYKEFLYRHNYTTAS